MKRAEMKLIRFGEGDVIATSACANVDCSHYYCTSVGDSTSDMQVYYYNEKSGNWDYEGPETWWNPMIENGTPKKDQWYYYDGDADRLYICEGNHTKQ